MAMKRAARDIEFSFLQGTYVADTDISTARKTRGMLAAITTNERAAAAADLDQLAQGDVNTVLKAMADSGAPFEQPVIFANAIKSNNYHLSIQVLYHLHQEIEILVE